MYDTDPLEIMIKDDENKVMSEKELIINLSKLFDKLNLMEQNNGYYHKEQNKIKVQLFELQKHIEDVSVENKLHCQITTFIDAIKNHHNKLEFFDNIKEKPEVYDELVHNFKEGMIAQSMLYKYFNMIYAHEVFADNKIFLKILQDTDDMFNVNPRDNSQHNKKRRYKILGEIPPVKERVTAKKNVIRIVKRDCLSKY